MEAVGRADLAARLHDYRLGLFMPGERKSVGPLAAVTTPARTAAQHQSLLHLVGAAPWSDEKVLRALLVYHRVVTVAPTPTASWFGRK